MADKLTFYHNPMSRGRIAHWMLEEVGVPYETKVIAFDKGEHKSPEYLAINPMGKIPAIVHNGTVVTEAAAICAYLADAFPKAGLAPPFERSGARHVLPLAVLRGRLHRACDGRQDGRAAEGRAARHDRLRQLRGHAQRDGEGDLARPVASSASASAPRMSTSARRSAGGCSRRRSSRGPRSRNTSSAARRDRRTSAPTARARRPASRSAPPTREEALIERVVVVDAAACTAAANSTARRSVAVSDQPRTMPRITTALSASPAPTPSSRSATRSTAAVIASSRVTPNAPSASGRHDHGFEAEALAQTLRAIEQRAAARVILELLELVRVHLEPARAADEALERAALPPRRTQVHVDERRQPQLAQRAQRRGALLVSRRERPVVQDLEALARQVRQQVAVDEVVRLVARQRELRPVVAGADAGAAGRAQPRRSARRACRAGRPACARARARRARPRRSA